MNAPRRPHPDRMHAVTRAVRGPADAHGLLPALLVGAWVLALAPNAHAGLYKWTDERGIVHYSDKMPADAVNRASIELSRQGLAIKKTEQARPAVQRMAKTESDEQRQRQAERERVLAARRDKALLESYTSEIEIDLAKSRAVATIDGQVQSAQAFIAQMEKRRAELEAKMSTYAPRPVPGEIRREIESIEAEVSRQNNFIGAKQRESESVAARYESDKQRFRELRSGEASGTAEGARVATVGAELQLTSGPPKP